MSSSEISETKHPPQWSKCSIGVTCLGLASAASLLAWGILIATGHTSISIKGHDITIFPTKFKDYASLTSYIAITAGSLGILVICAVVGYKKWKTMPNIEKLVSTNINAKSDTPNKQDVVLERTPIVIHDIHKNGIELTKFVDISQTALFDLTLRKTYPRLEHDIQPGQFYLTRQFRRRKLEDVNDSFDFGKIVYDADGAPYMYIKQDGFTYKVYELTDYLVGVGSQGDDYLCDDGSYQAKVYTVGPSNGETFSAENVGKLVGKHQLTQQRYLPDQEWTEVES